MFLIIYMVGVYSYCSGVGGQMEDRSEEELKDIIKSLQEGTKKKQTSQRSKTKKKPIKRKNLRATSLWLKLRHKAIEPDPDPVNMKRKKTVEIRMMG